jgi:hypothetical protein
MTAKEKKRFSSSITGITLYLTPGQLDEQSLKCTYTKPTISDQDRKTKIENHIDKFSSAWEELAKR